MGGSEEEWLLLLPGHINLEPEGVTATPSPRRNTAVGLGLPHPLVHSPKGPQACLSQLFSLLARGPKLSSFFTAFKQS